MAPPIAFGSSETRFTLSAMAITLFTSTNTMRTAISHAPWPVESNFATLCAFPLDIALIVGAILWASFAYPFTGAARCHFVKEWKAASHTSFGLACLAIASFRTSTFWASFITQVATPASFASVVAFAVLLVASSTFAPTRALLVAFLSEESVLASAFAKTILFIALVVFTSFGAFIFARLSPPLEIFACEALAILFLAAWNPRFLELHKESNVRGLRTICWAWLVTPQSMVVNFALLWASTFRQEGFAIWSTNQIVIKHTVWAILWARLLALPSVVA